MNNWLVALPVYNEAAYVDQILTEVTKYAENILVVDDGSSDETPDRLEAWKQSSGGRRGVEVVRHSENRGYGAALKSAFQFASQRGFESLVTMDCDGQHQPQRIPRFVAVCKHADIVSGSRYLKKYPGDSQPPSQRLFINRHITGQLNELLGLELTDAFCGFKAYRVEALQYLDIQDNGYAMPLELWVQAAMRGLSVMEVPVPLIYLDPTRSFGGSLDEADKRLEHYNEVIAASVRSMQERGFRLPEKAASGCRFTQ